MEEMKHVIVFTGHMIDKEGRKEPRFPAGKENAARAEIQKLLRAEKNANDKLTGIAGGACGGDILFHEVCGELNIPSEIYLAMPAEEFKKHSVSFAGKIWEDRFDALIKKIPVHILPTEKNEESIWEATNIWMLESADEIEKNNITLIALWDGKGGDGPGGTESMINTAKKKNAKINIIDITKVG
jgi:hypothetical protein